MLLERYRNIMRMAGKNHSSALGKIHFQRPIITYDVVQSTVAHLL